MGLWDLICRHTGGNHRYLVLEYVEDMASQSMDWAMRSSNSLMVDGLSHPAIFLICDA